MAQSASAQDRFPDFIIGGAPKCGTTSIHFILKQHPEIGIPDEEIHFFDADDPVSHPDFLFTKGPKLEWFDPRPSATDSVQWYASRFTPHAEAKLIGEDSTTYLFSNVAPARIKAMLPDVRLVFMLRDPVKRAYSQYWHMIRSSRATCSFEQAIIEHPSIMLGSTYTPNLERYLKVFGQGQVKIAVFEDFLADQQGFMDDMTSYLGASQMSLDTAETWFNRTFYPSNP
ncbi:MAG: sulfotransferase, partial [Pseudomonadota bacterium]